MYCVKYYKNQLLLSTHANVVHTFPLDYCAIHLSTYLIFVVDSEWVSTFKRQLKTYYFHGLCGSNKLLYKRCAKSMGRPKFRPPHSSHIFQPILMKLETRKDIRDTTPQAKFGWCGTTGRGSAEGVYFPLPFVFYLSIYLSFFCILVHAYRSHQKTDHDRLWLKTRVSA